MRPRTIDEYVGQEHFLGPGKLLRRMLLADRISSLIFYGPPGCGKTALAHVIANQTKSKFRPMNAVSAGIKDVREVLQQARHDLEYDGRRTILFLDEIHRFNRSQQDVLLPDVEEGVVILIGATTQNPFFAINTPLLSRSQIFTFEPLTREHIATVIRRALADTERGLGDTPVTLTDDALAFLCEACDGDARRALTALEIGVKSATVPLSAGGEGLGMRGTGEANHPTSPLEGEVADTAGGGGRGVKRQADPPPGSRSARTDLPLKGGGGQPQSSASILFDLQLAQDSIQRKVLDFDPTGDTHYDVASAFIKSLRGSDPQAGVYWLARMLESGEDPRFVARRLVIFASEDVGNADPQALLVANAAWDAVERVGLPECQLNLSQAVCYLATAPKSNAATVAIGLATKDVKEGRTLPVPKHLRDSHYQGSKQFGHVGYQYAHDGDGGWVDQEYIPSDAVYYTPTDRGFEATIRERMAEIEKRRKLSRDPKGTGE
ncbi:MAG: replication-associated recombination protein A [Fimbriiglobus sp.]|nr:replication-associated recombination protein A [Fimbriiglobus sp.]